MNVLFNNRNKNSVYIQNENHETRLCGNERLKDDFFDVCSVGGLFGFVVEEDEDEDEDEEEVNDDDDGGGGIWLLISCVVVWLVDGDREWGNGDDGIGETEKSAGVIGDGRDGIENGVVGDGILNVPCWGESNEHVIGSFVISSFDVNIYGVSVDNIWWDTIGDGRGDKTSIAPVNGDCTNVGS